MLVPALENIGMINENELNLAHPGLLRMAALCAEAQS